MGYENPNQYIIENDVEETDKPIYKKELKSASMRNSAIPENYEIEEDKPSRIEEVQNEIYEAAKEEGFVSEGLVGGEGATSEEVISALINEELPEGAKKKQEEYEDKQSKVFQRVTATRDLLTGRMKKIIPVYVKIVEDVRHRDGTISPELIELEFKVRRLTETQVNHLINHRLVNKLESEMTDEEYQESTEFRSNFLESVVVDPQITAEEWRNEIDAPVLTAVFGEVSKVLNSVDDTSLFQ